MKFTFRTKENMLSLIKGECNIHKATCVDIMLDCCSKAATQFRVVEYSTTPAQNRKWCTINTPLLENGVLRAHWTGASSPIWEIEDEDFDSSARINFNSDTVTIKTAWSGFKYTFFNKNGKHYCTYEGAINGFMAQNLMFKFHPILDGLEIVRCTKGVHLLKEYLLLRGFNVQQVCTFLGKSIYKEYIENRGKNPAGWESVLNNCLS